MELIVVYNEGWWRDPLTAKVNKQKIGLNVQSQRRERSKLHCDRREVRQRRMRDSWPSCLSTASAKQWHCEETVSSRVAWQRAEAGHMWASTGRLVMVVKISASRGWLRVPERLVKEAIWHGSGCQCMREGSKHVSRAEASEKPPYPSLPRTVQLSIVYGLQCDILVCFTPILLALYSRNWIWVHMNITKALES